MPDNRINSNRNLLFIVSDQHRRDAAGCYGHPFVKTPHIDALAERGARFNAYCQAPLCAPSRASLLTGTHPHTCEAYTGRFQGAYTPLRKGIPTLAEAFRNHNFATAAIGKVHIVGETAERDLGFEYRDLRYYTDIGRQYEDRVDAEVAAKYRMRNGWPTGWYNPENRPCDIPEDKMYDQLVVLESIRFLREHRDKPFSLWVGLEKPHTSWHVPPEYHAMYNPADMPLPPAFGRPLRDVPDFLVVHQKTQEIIPKFPPEKARGAIAAYHACVSYMDAMVGELLAALEREGLRENTLVVYTADHGELLFEHMLLQKQCFFESAVAVPLLLAGNGIPANFTSNRIVSLLDLVPTVADLLDIKPLPDAEGRSLAPLLRGKKADAPEECFSEYYGDGISQRMIRTPQWKYVHADGKPAQLYDMNNDTDELQNLVANPALMDVREQLERRVCEGWEVPAPDAIRPRK